MGALVNWNASALCAATDGFYTVQKYNLYYQILSGRPPHRNRSPSKGLDPSLSITPKYAVCR
jgi:hypothetical protein